jgi:hypothetical protein
MTKNKKYEIVKEIELHTKPLRTVNVLQQGVFKRETEKSYIFDEFFCRKKNVVSVTEIQ